MKPSLSFIFLFFLSGVAFSAPQPLLDSDLREIHGSGLESDFFLKPTEFFQNSNPFFSQDALLLATSVHAYQKDALVQFTSLNPLLSTSYTSASLLLTPPLGSTVLPFAGFPFLPQLPKKSGD